MKGHSNDRVGSVRGWLGVLLVMGLILITGCIPGNEPPKAVIHAKPTQGKAPLTVYFDGTDSYDPDGSIITYHWDFGDGVTCPPDCGTEDPIAPRHEYTKDGTYKVRLTVTDDKGAKGSDLEIIKVGVTPPLLFFDDFEDGPDPAWWTEPGWEDRWVVKDGRYTLAVDDKTVRDLPVRSFVGKPSWSDYSVDVDVMECYGGGRVAIFLRLQDNGDAVAFFAAEDAGHPYYGSIAGFRVRKKGAWQDVDYWDYSPVYKGIYNFHLSVSANGSVYSAAFNAEPFVTVEIKDFPTSGYVGIQAAYWGNTRHVTAFDNFKVTAISAASQ